MTQKQFKRLNTLSCKFWIELTDDERNNICFGRGTLTVIESVAKMLNIKITRKDCGLDLPRDSDKQGRIDIINNNMLKTEAWLNNDEDPQF